MSGIIERLTEGVVNRDMRAEGHALLSKWERTGLLEGMTNDRTRNGMARLLENQAKELLRESSTMAGGDVEGFAAVAFPIVRRVFAGLIANDLVSVQPMSLPSGLIFFLDFTTSTSGPGLPRLGYGSGSTEQSLWGGGVVGSQLTGGVDLSGDNASSGPYALNNGYSSATGSVSAANAIKANDFVLIASGTAGAQAGTGANPLSVEDQATLDKLTQYDVDLSGSVVVVLETTGSAAFAQLNVQDLVALNFLDDVNVNFWAIQDAKLVRRCTRVSSGSTTQDPSSAAYKMTMVFAQKSGSVTLFGEGKASGKTHGGLMGYSGSNVELRATFPIDDNLTNGDALGSVIGTTEWGLEGVKNIPEIDIKVDSVAVTAKTKKLKAKWTPELGQDLNAYHNLDAEVELTSILSEQIALEIDREILEDLVQGATAGTYYWARSPGLFVNRETGVEIGASSAAPDFTGTVSEWYETLAETINDVSAQIHRKTLRGGANFVVCGPEVANILEFTAGFRASVTADDDKGSIGAVKVGSLSKKFDVMVDPYFPRSVVLVGRRGSSFLESGYVYAPYVPLQTTPTIFGPEDFVPRKGVMTRYAKKMVRPDMYGIVIVRGILGEAGATS
tara:strand:- start:2467 stop:4314 length:1848 start_codon:yes stop_codon:yes gene_type:complete